MTEISFWMLCDTFTVHQAAALWCNYDPSKLDSVLEKRPSELSEIYQMLVSAIKNGELKVDASDNSLNFIGDHKKSYVKRTDLETFARNRNLFPTFLFDTLAPFAAQANLQSPARPVTLSIPASPSTVPPNTVIGAGTNRGGRPTLYDWDSFTMEIIHRANQPDGLPEIQAHLVGEMLLWFQSKFGAEPAVSSVKDRISKIYKYIGEAKNPKD